MHKSLQEKTKTKRNRKINDIQWIAKIIIIQYWTVNCHWIKFTSFPYANRWCTVSNDLYTTTQFAFCVRSTNKLAKCGIDTFGSFVQWTKSEKYLNWSALKNYFRSHLLINPNSLVHWKRHGFLINFNLNLKRKIKTLLNVSINIIFFVGGVLNLFPSSTCAKCNRIIVVYLNLSIVAFKSTLIIACGWY